MSAKGKKKKVETSLGQKRKWLPIIVLVITTFLYYGNTLKNGFSLDDDLVTSTDNSVHERVEKGISGVPEIFTTHYAVNKKQRYDYRPFVTSLFAIEYELFGDNSIEKRASISHFINVCLYAITILLIYLLVYKLLPEKKWQIPFVTAFLFLLHPIHSEVVNNIKCRDELMVFILGGLSALFLLKYIDAKQKKIWYLGLAMLMIFIAVLTKTTGQIFIVVVPLMLYFFRDVKFKTVVGYFGILIAGFVLARALERGVLPEEQIRDLMYFENPLAYSDSFLDRIPMFFYTNFFYLKMMIFPAPLVYYYGYDQIPIADWSLIGVWIGVLFVVVGTIVSIIRIKQKKIWSFGILFFLFGIGGAANLLFPTVGIVGERFAFIASFGLIFMTAYYSVYFFELVKSRNVKYLFYIIGGAVIILSLTQVVERNKAWNSRFSLYGNDIKHLSKSAKAHSLLGTEYVVVADSVAKTPNYSYSDYMSYIDSAILEFETCVKIYNGYYNAANNAGALYFTRKKDYYKARPLFKLAVSYKQDYVEALFNYGKCFDYDLKGVKELQIVLNKTKIDTVVNRNGSVPDTLGYLEERKAALATYMIKNEVRQVLSSIRLNNSNWKNIAIYQIMLSIKTHINVERGWLNSKVNVAKFEQIVKQHINNANNENAQSQLQILMSYIESSLYQILTNEIYMKSLQNLDYLGNIQQKMIELNKVFMDSSERYWYRSLEANPNYYYSYKALTGLYLNENNFEGVLGVNAMAIEEGGFNDNTEFYINIGNIYNSKLQYSEAINYMRKAIDEIDENYNVALGSEGSAGDKQDRLNELFNRKKQILGFISRIYYDMGDQVNSQNYYNLQMEF